MRWRPVLGVALGVTILTFLLARLVVFSWDQWGFYLYGETRGAENVYDFLWFQQSVGAYVIPALHFLLTFLGAAWVARRVGEAKAHGLLVGLLAAFYNQAVMTIVWPTVSPSQLLAGWGLLALPFLRMAEYLALGLAGGSLGSATARTMLARRESLYRASRDVSAARDPREISTAIGCHLAGPRTAGVALWEAAPPNGTPGFELLDAWLPRDSQGWPSGERLDAAWFPELWDRAPLTVSASSLPEAERQAWTKAGVRSLLLVPLLALGEEKIGLLAVASRGRWRAFSRGAVRRYSTVGAQAALALENMRLVEEARRVGQEAGTLRERNRLAREILDTLAQGFVSIVMNLEASEGGQDSDRLRDEKIERTARESLSEARRLVRALGPRQLENATLPGALEDLARRFSEETGTRAEAVVDGEPTPLPAGAEADLLRVAQEALHNVRKHAGASRVMLSLSYMGDRVVLDVRDDGAGFDPARITEKPADGTSGGFGLMGVRYRMEEGGGALHLDSAPGEGTTLTVEMPVEASGSRLQVRAKNRKPKPAARNLQPPKSSEKRSPQSLPLREARTRTGREKPEPDD